VSVASVPVPEPVVGIPAPTVIVPISVFIKGTLLASIQIGSADPVVAAAENSEQAGAANTLDIL
jgi:hypothetical protein